MKGGVLDNDVVFKGACYGLLDDLAAFVDQRPGVVGILGAAPYVVRAAIVRAHLRTDKAEILSRLDRFVITATLLEPTADERDLAASIELSAQRRALPLHGGESQLCAIAVARGMDRMLTGDKQAIVALEQLLELQPELLAMVGKVFCLEQAILFVTIASGAGIVRAGVCSEPTVDTALAMCFSCAAGESWSDDSARGLQSYIDSLRVNAARVLAA